jgi:ribonuclease Z
MTQIEVTFLGTTAGIPTKNRSHPSIYIRYVSENEFCYLFDCGEGTQRQILFSGLNFMRINDIFVTHWHADHFAGLFGLIETMNLEGRTKPLRIFGPEADKFVELILEIGYSSKGFDIIPQNVEYEGMAEQKLIEENEFYICAIPVKHSIPAVAYAFVEKDRIKIDKVRAKAFGMPEKGPIYKKIKENGSALFNGKKIDIDDIALIEKGKRVVYSGDTLPCKNVVKLARDASLLIHDSTFFTESLDKSYKHATFEDVLKMAKEANAKEVILTHISRRYQDLEELKEKIREQKNVKIAKDFMKIIVS